MLLSSFPYQRPCLCLSLCTRVCLCRCLCICVSVSAYASESHSILFICRLRIFASALPNHLLAYVFVCLRTLCLSFSLSRYALVSVSVPDFASFFACVVCLALTSPPPQSLSQRVSLPSSFSVSILVSLSAAVFASSSSSVSASVRLSVTVLGSVRPVSQCPAFCFISFSGSVISA